MRGTNIDPGNATVGQPSFRNTLSSGDKSTLALALFVAQAQMRKDLAEVIIVFDDPFTSLDVFRQHWTCNTIRRLATTAKQVLVFSHSVDFLKILAKGFDGAHMRTVRVDRYNTHDSRIFEFDLNDAAAPLVDRNVTKLRNYITGDDPDTNSTGKCIRPLLENYIRLHAPDECPEVDGWLGDMLGKIKAADPASPLAMFQPHYEELDFLNDYSKPHHHDPARAPTINPDELLNAAKMTMRIIGRPVRSVMPIFITLKRHLGCGSMAAFEQSRQSR